MMQLSLFSLPPELREIVLWCHPCITGSDTHFILGLRPPLPFGVAPWLRQHCRITAIQGLPSGTIAVRAQVPTSLSVSFRSLPRPRGGSRHEVNLLPFY